MLRSWAGAAGVVLIELAAVGLDACGSGSSTAPGPDSGGGIDAAGSGSGGDGSATDGASSSSGSGSSSGGDASPDAPSVLARCQTPAPGVSDCGSAAESCCASSVVPADTYDRSYALGGADGGLASAADPATVSAFRLDKYEVTVGRFRQFVAAWSGGAGWTPPEGSGKHAHLNGGQGLAGVGAAYEPGWVATDDGNVAPTDANLSSCAPYSAWTSTAGTQERLPINCVNWYEAYAFCVWDGGFLPSEAEWESAAAGGSEQRAYPWGNAPPGTGNQFAIYGFEAPLDGGATTPGCYYPSSGPCMGVVNIAPVGSAPAGAGAWGHLDLAGNVMEWVLDSWNAVLADPCSDCAELASGPNRSLRGGSFVSYTPIQLTPTSRSDTRAVGRNDYGGIRCARTP